MRKSLSLIGRGLRVLATALLACGVLAFLTPRGGAVGAYARAHPLAFGCVWFVVFSWMAHHWWPAPAASGGASWRSTLALAAAAGVVAWIGRTRIGGVYEVTSGSMLPTLAAGDVVAGRKLALGPLRRGDVVVFRGMVKRVVGLPGDRVAMRGSVPVINEQPAQACDAGEYVEILGPGGGVVHGRVYVEQLDGAAYLTVHSAGRPFALTYTVGPDEVFVLGDDRGESVDSRSWNEGRGAGVPLVDIEARVDRFLVGSRRSGEPDWSRFLQRLDALQIRARVEGVATGATEEAIGRCLAGASAGAARSAQVSPPNSGEATLKIGGL